MSTNKMRATFSQRGDEIAGTISVEGDGLFMLECLGLLVENLAAKVGTSPVNVDATVINLDNCPKHPTPDYMP